MFKKCLTGLEEFTGVGGICRWSESLTWRSEECLRSHTLQKSKVYKKKNKKTSRDLWELLVQSQKTQLKQDQCCLYMSALWLAIGFNAALDIQDLVSASMGDNSQESKKKSLKMWFPLHFWYNAPERCWTRVTGPVPAGPFSAASEI